MTQASKIQAAPQPDPHAATGNGRGPEEVSAEAMLRAIVADCVSDFDRYLAEFMETYSPDGPHKTRVALRRLTTALDAFQPLMRKSEAKRMRTHAKDIFRRLGLVRDADVYHLAQAGQDAGPTPETRALRDAVRVALRRREALAFGPLMLRKLTDDTLLRDSGSGLRARAAPASILAGAATDRAFAALDSHGKALTKMEDTARHEFRKDLKSLRYLTDFFTAAGPEKPLDADIEALQDVLGTLNDLANARAREGKGSKGKPPRRGKPELDALKQADALWARIRKSAPWWRAPSG